MQQAAQHKEQILTFIQRMGSKSTHSVHLTHLRVRRQKVLCALRWLKLHNVDYHDIQIKEENLDWMGSRDMVLLKNKEVNVKTTDCQLPCENPYFARVQYSLVDTKEDYKQFHILADSDQLHIPTAEQYAPIKELTESLGKDQKDKLLHFPPHGDTPVK